MLFLLTNRTRPGLTPEQFAELATRAKAFYGAIPPGVTLLGEWAAVDQSHNVTLMEAPDLDTVQRVQAPFEPFVETTVVPVVAISGWTAT